MWLSRVLNRGFVRMRKIFSIGRTTTGSRLASFQSTGRDLIRLDSIVTIYPAGLRLLQRRRESLSTISGKHSISRYPIQKTNNG